MRVLALLLCVLTFAGFSSCTDTTTTPTNTTLVARTLTFTPDSVTNYHYSLDSNGLVYAAFYPTSAWDINVMNVWGGGRSRQIDVLFNSGTVNAAGLTKAYVVDTTFDNVTTYDNSKFMVDDTASSKRISSVALDGTGIFNYNMTTNTITPNPQKTLIIKTAGGTVYKLQFVSLTVAASRYAQSTFSIRYIKASGTRLK